MRGILLSGEVASGRVCVCSVRSRFAFAVVVVFVPILINVKRILFFNGDISFVISIAFFLVKVISIIRKKKNY